MQVLLGGAEPLFRLNELALSLLEQLGIAKIWCKQLVKQLTAEQDYTQEQIDALLFKNAKHVNVAISNGVEDRHASLTITGLEQGGFPKMEGVG